jgi:glycosyltransferase involved in cell wall biosynthesis
MAAGVPCIVSARGGNEEVVCHGRNGLVVPPQDVARLVEALCSLASDEGLRARLAAGAKDTARAFDLAETVARTERVLLNGSGS